MSEMISVVGVEPRAGYHLRLRFSDGTRGEVDLSRRLRGRVFEPLRDPAFFRKVRLDRAGGTVVWPNGADIAPELLHDLARRSIHSPSAANA